MTYDFSELKTVQFSNLVALRVPARWNVETRPDFDWYCTEGEEESGSLNVFATVRRWPEGASVPDLKSTAEDFVTEFASKLGRPPLENALSEFRHGYLHKYVCNFDDGDGVMLLSYRYTLIQFHADIFAVITLTLVIVEADAGRSDMCELVAIIESAVHEIDLLLYRNRRISLPELRELQTIKCGSSLSLRVPARWDLLVNHEEDEGWICYRKGEVSGTLWITINRFRRPTSVEKPKFSLRSFLDQMVSTRLQNREAPAFGSKISEIESGYLWSYDFRAEENGDDLHYFRNVFVVADDTEVVLVTFGLVISVARLMDRDIRSLVALVDREVRATKLTVLSDAAKSRGSVPFPFPEAMSFDGKLIVSLPGFITVSPQGEGRVYCSFPPDITASMWIMISDHKLSDRPFDDDGTIAHGIFDFLERHFADDLHEETVIARFPRGFLFYSVYDGEDQTEDESDDPADQWKRFGFRNHVWRYFRIGTEIVRQAQFMLMLPVREPDKRELKSLRMALAREIQKARFPDLN